jgi:diketogulonate reductase-like aldo/keto reductase
MEKALREGKAKMIGVSNYPAPLLEEMQSYAEVMPAVN